MTSRSRNTVHLIKCNKLGAIPTNSCHISIGVNHFSVLPSSARTFLLIFGCGVDPCRLQQHLSCEVELQINVLFFRRGQHTHLTRSHSFLDLIKLPRIAQIHLGW